MCVFFFYFIVRQFGAVLGNFFSGTLLHYYNSWHLVFYAFGVCGVVLSILFVSITIMFNSLCVCVCVNDDINEKEETQCIYEFMYIIYWP